MVAQAHAGRLCLGDGNLAPWQEHPWPGWEVSQRAIRNLMRTRAFILALLTVNMDM